MQQNILENFLMVDYPNLSKKNQLTTIEDNISYLWRKYVQDHTKLNYIFALEGGDSIDAARAGNEGRYLNHSVDIPNCTAYSEFKCLFRNWLYEFWSSSAPATFVNGDNRIGLYSSMLYCPLGKKYSQFAFVTVAKRIAAGEELLLNYGELYWKGGEEPEGEVEADADADAEETEEWYQSEAGTTESDWPV